MRVATVCINFFLAFIPTTRIVAFAAHPLTDRIHRGMPRGGSKVAIGSDDRETVSDARVFASKEISQNDITILSNDVETKRPLRVLFLSSDTGGGHRASAEALAKQFLLQFPGSEYELADLWTDHGVLPYRTLVNTYKHFSAHPFQWRIFYHLSNTKINEVGANIHSKITCGKKIKNRIQSFNPDVIVSVHPTMNHTPLIQTQKISKELGKHIPFFTVVTDLGSGHSMWFERNVNKLYVASERLYNLARRRGGTPKEKIVMTGLPIRHGFAVQAEKLGDRTTAAGKEYQKEVRAELGINPDKPVVLVMGGGEGVGSLSDIVNELYVKLSASGVDATICVVCGRNEKLKNDLATRDWAAVAKDVENKPRRKRRIMKLFNRSKRNKNIEEMFKASQETTTETSVGTKGNVDVMGLGFITNMPDYMVAADILVSKAGPGTIAEAAAVGLPIMMTSFLPGQEAGNVDVVLEKGFGDYCEEPNEIAKQITYWLQNQDLLDSMSVAAREAGNPYAADEIVRDIGSQTVAWMALNEIK